jgi:superfamily I DNA/RNA helicase
MKGIIKTRNFDSLKKLSYKRAKGKKSNITELNKQTHTAIITLEKLGLLTPELLWDLIERRKYLYTEQYKLEWVMRAREKNLSLFSEDVEHYIKNHSNISIAVLRIPYEIRIIPKYRDYVTKREISYGKRI